MYVFFQAMDNQILNVGRSCVSVLKGHVGMTFSMTNCHWVSMQVRSQLSQNVPSTSYNDYQRLSPVSEEWRSVMYLSTCWIGFLVKSCLPLSETLLQ